GPPGAREGHPGEGDERVDGEERRGYDRRADPAGVWLRHQPGRAGGIRARFRPPRPRPGTSTSRRPPRPPTDGRTRRLKHVRVGRKKSCRTHGRSGAGREKMVMRAGTSWVPQKYVVAPEVAATYCLPPSW